MVSNNAAVMIPTYNEAENIELLLKQLQELNLEVLVIDDNSPDGTANLVNSLKLPKVTVLYRQKKDGLGNAYKAGIAHLLENSKFTHLISMDADGSHRVEDLKKLIQSINDADLIIGSRWIEGGKIVDWPWQRKWLSRFGTWYASKLLGLPIQDITGGFRIYNRKALEKIDFKSIKANGYCYQIEMAYAFKDKKIKEVPITFVERTKGQSKMNINVVVEAMATVTMLGLRRVIRR